MNTIRCHILILTGICTLSLFRIYAPQFTIDSPGLVTLGEDIAYEPTVPSDSIILITANKVILDFANHRISQATGNSQAGLNGVSLATGVSQVTIKNGFIDNITGKGIVVNPGASDIIIDSITTTSCGLRAFEFQGSPLAPLVGVTLSNSSIIGCCWDTSGDFGIFMQLTFGFQLINTLLNNNSISSHNFTGIRIDNCAIGRLVNVANVGSRGLSSVKGFDVTSSNNILFSGTFAGNYIAAGSSASLIGYDIRSTTSNNIFDNCIAFANTATAANSICIGFNFDTGANNNTIINCKSLSIIGSSTAVGMNFVSNANNLVENCILENNMSLNSVVSGCLMTSCTNLRMLNNIISSHISLTSTAVGIDLNNSSVCMCKNNTITKVQGFTDAMTYGIRQSPTGSSSDNIFVSNTAVHNGVTSPIDTNQFSGFSSAQMSVVPKQAVNSISAPLTNAAFI